MEKNHTWKAKLYNRTLNNFYDCPVCSNKIVQRGVNDFLTLASEELLLEVDHKSNLLSHIKLGNLHPRSKVNIWWRCSIGHSWRESPHNRSRGTGCPYCSGKRTANENTLLNGGDIIIREYSSNNSKKLSEVSIKSRTLVEWECNGVNFNGDAMKHYWKASPFNRVYKNQKCPYCSNVKTLKGFNDVGVTHPEFYEELAYKNILVRFNESKNVEWICSTCSYRYFTTPRNKIMRGDKCKGCSNSKVSGGEIELLEYIKSFYKGVVIHGDRKILGGKELDIYLPELDIAFEFNGDFWHGDEWLLKTKKVTAKEWHGHKKALAKKSRIDLYFVWERDWVNNRRAVETAIIPLINDKTPSKILEKLE